LVHHPTGHVLPAARIMVPSRGRARRIVPRRRRRRPVRDGHIALAFRVAGSTVQPGRGSALGETGEGRLHRTVHPRTRAAGGELGRPPGENRLITTSAELARGRCVIVPAVVIFVMPGRGGGRASVRNVPVLVVDRCRVGAAGAVAAGAG
jgi:hypothetical protein